jgi:hypothetical protein
LPGPRSLAIEAALPARRIRPGAPLSSSARISDPLEEALVVLNTVGGGRTWWAHFELTRINIEPTILRKKIEDPHNLRAAFATARLVGSIDGYSRSVSISADNANGCCRRLG